MAGRSPNEVVLSEPERAALEHVAACYTRPHREVLRAKVVLMAADGLTNTEIGAGLGMSREAAGRWRGVESCARAPVAQELGVRLVERGARVFQGILQGTPTEGASDQAISKRLLAG